MRRWTKLAPFLYERFDGIRVHTGGLVMVPDGRRRRVVWSGFQISDVLRPEWKRAQRMEPKPRRALLLLADTIVPDGRTEG